MPSGGRNSCDPSPLEAVDVRFVTADGIQAYDVSALTELLGRGDGFVWLDVPRWEELAEAVLTDVFGAHPLVVEACKQRNHVPTVHGYSDHLFVVLHSPLAGRAGHVHLLELDQIVGRNHVVTVHGPINPVVPEEHAFLETAGVLRRIESGRFRPRSPGELSYAVTSAIARRQRALIGEIAERIPELEDRVMSSSFRNPEELLEEMFLLRHELITVRTMASQSHDIYARISSLVKGIPADDLPYVKDAAEQFERVRSIGEGESHFLFNVIDLYQTRVSTKMTVAMERLAVIAAVTLPITALASVYGMNVIVNEKTQLPQVIAVLLVMVVISSLLLRWAKKQGWW
jgi:magnesium transporter